MPPTPFPGTSTGRVLLACLTLVFLRPLLGAREPEPAPPAAGAPIGRTVHYRHVAGTNLAATVVRAWTLALGPETAGLPNTPTQRWLHLQATKADGTRFQLWLRTAGYPVAERHTAGQAVSRYLLREGVGPVLEFRDRLADHAVLPSVAGWRYLLPRDRDDVEAGFSVATPPTEAHLLGHRYRLASVAEGPVPAVPTPDRVITLRPDLLVGLPSNRRQLDETRRYDGSDYKYRRLTRADYRELVAAGFNCLRVDAEQLGWVEDLDAFHWGVGPGEVPFPECLYRSTYLGPALFLDEPAVGTRDHTLRPRLARDAGFRGDLTPGLAFDAFRHHFDEVLRQGAPVQFQRALGSRPEIDPGSMNLVQANLYSWETMVATAGYQLGRDPEVPTAMVFEPPGRVGTRRIVPEFDMSYGCQLAIDDPRHLTDVVYGFLRGAARATGKAWGTSVYGAVEPADAPWLLTRAYDLGATRFFFWDNYQLACVPYSECLALARILQAHAAAHPQRDLARLRRAAEVLLLLPPGYNLGHVHLGKGSLWGLPELNLERRNPSGVSHRAVMSALFGEIERCFRLGLAFDLLWDLPTLRPTGYREIVRVREDARLEVETEGRRTLLAEPRRPVRPDGQPPRLDVRLSPDPVTAAATVTATAEVTETSAAVYYTTGADPGGVYHNAVVDWELFGPAEEDYRPLTPADHRPRVRPRPGGYEVTSSFRIEQAGNYRLRAAVCDRAGRTSVRWTEIAVR